MRWSCLSAAFRRRWREHGQSETTGMRLLWRSLPAKQQSWREGTHPGYGIRDESSNCPASHSVHRPLPFCADGGKVPVTTARRRALNRPPRPGAYAGPMRTRGRGFSQAKPPPPCAHRAATIGAVCSRGGEHIPPLVIAAAPRGAAPRPAKRSPMPGGPRRASAAHGLAACASEPGLKGCPPRFALRFPRAAVSVCAGPLYRGPAHPPPMGTPSTQGREGHSLQYGITSTQKNL